jgi:DNA polymerase
LLNALGGSGWSLRDHPHPGWLKFEYESSGGLDHKNPRIEDRESMTAGGTDLNRALLQRLESLRRAGLTHLPRAGEPLTIPLETEETPAVVSAAHATEAIAGEKVTKSSPVARPTFGERREPETVPDRGPTLFGGGNAAASGLSPSEREAELRVLAEEVAACTLCQELADTRTRTVFGVGNPAARILFLGEAPGREEDLSGEPFVGPAGQLLDRIIKACTLTREEIYICNILRCRPPMNRNPSPTEAGNCRRFLDAQIRIVDPEYIVCWGSVAARNLLDTTAAIGRLRGRFFRHGRAKVLCTYHPSYLLRNPAAKKDVWEDMKFFMKDLGVDLG